jgi:hypothetical protein
MTRCAARNLANQRRPRKCTSHATGLYPHGFSHATDDLRMDLNQLAAGLGTELNLASALERVHGQKGICNGGGSGEQTMVFQHHEVGVAQICLQTGFFVIPERDAFVAVIGQGRQHKRALLADRRDTALLSTDRRTGSGVHVNHALNLGACLMNRVVNDKPRRIQRKRAVLQLVALHVDLDQAGRRARRTSIHRG